MLAAALVGAVMAPPGAAMAAGPSTHSGVSLRQDSFPAGYFYIRNVASGLVLGTEDGSTKPGGRVVLWDKKPSDNQLWKYDHGFLVNKNSGLVLEVPGYEHGGDITRGTALTQNTRREAPESLNQLWASNYDHLMPYDPKAAVAPEGGNAARGTRAVIDSARVGDPEQEWVFDLP
ncbi:RICIN domain-containing protein [Streptomyces sp. NPDC003233]